MLSGKSGGRLGIVDNERGAVLVITAIVMLTVFIAAAWAIDTAIWFVHNRHLQTQADAAAFAGAGKMAEGMISGNCSDSSIRTVIAQYDGSQTPSAGQVLPANQQLPRTPTYSTVYSPTAHNLFDQINKPNFENQSIPADAGLTGSPCADAAVDVKMTETNLPSFLTIIEPPYLNKQARVSAQTVASQGAAPFILPNISTPTDVAVFVVGENATTPAFSTDTILATLGACADNGNTQPCLTSSNSGGTWSASGVSVPFGASPASLVVAQSTSAISSSTLNGVTTGAQLVTFCSSSGISCYANSAGTGLTYTRTYSTTTPNFPTQPPVVEDTSVSDLATDPTQCNSTGTTNLFTGFIAASSTCNVNVAVDMNFGSETCTDLANNLKATLTVVASSGGSAPLNCPNPSGSATGNWTTASTLAIPANSGPVTFDLKWSRTGGGSAVPKEPWEQGGITSGNKTGQCGNSSSACTADFKIVQRVFTGAFDQNTASTSPSGPVAGAALISGGGELMSTPINTTQSNLGVTIDFQGLYDALPDPNGFIRNGSFSDIAFGTQQGNGLADCGQGVNNAPGTNGFDVQENAIAGLFTCTNFPVIPAPGTCGTNNCPGTVPGNKFIQWLDGGLATRIFGCPEAAHSTQNNEKNGCTSNPLPAASCQADPNYWSTQNKLFPVESNSSDPRLVSVMVTDPGNLANGNHDYPIRHYAEFYVTGWTNDPCSGVSISGTNSSNSLNYVSDDIAPTDAAGDFFLVGHFVHYFDPNAVPGTQKCVLNSIDNCTLTLTQ